MLFFEHEGDNPYFFAGAPQDTEKFCRLSAYFAVCRLFRCPLIRYSWDMGLGDQSLLYGIKKDIFFRGSFFFSPAKNVIPEWAGKQGMVFRRNFFLLKALPPEADARYEFYRTFWGLGHFSKYPSWGL